MAWLVTEPETNLRAGNMVGRSLGQLGFPVAELKTSFDMATCATFGSAFKVVLGSAFGSATGGSRSTTASSSPRVQHTARAGDDPTQSLGSHTLAGQRA